MTPATSTISAAAAAHPPPPAAAAESTATAAAVIDRERDSFGQLSSCWLRLLRSGQQADLQLICREEKVLPCHRLVIGLRCPPLLSQAVQERSAAHGKVETKILFPVLRIRDILVRIRIRGFVYRSGSGSCYFVIDLKAPTKNWFFYLLLFEGTFASLFKDKKS
jgi:hypothetical protein